MEESEYKSTYNQVAEIRCEFEKALTNHKAKCSLSRHFWLADREGYACKSEEAADKCRQVLKKLREKSQFVLKLQEAAEKLPHNMEIRVQAGGMQGVYSLFHADPVDVIEDIHSLVQKAESEYGSLEAMPYSEIVQSVSRFQGRRTRKNQDK